MGIFFKCMILLLFTNEINSQSNSDMLPTQLVKDTFFGKIYEDPYRFLENTKDTVVDTWLRQQSNQAKVKVRKISNWESILLEQKKSQRDRPRKKYLEISENNIIFYIKKEVNEKNFKLYLRNGFKGKEVLLYDPINYKKDTDNKYVINYIKPSWDGSKIVIGMTKRDEEISEMIVFDVKNKKLLPEIIYNCWPAELGGVCWLKDNSGFYYQHIPVIDKSSKDYLLNTASTLYKLSDCSGKKKVIFSAINNPSLNIDSADFPIVKYKSYYGDILIAEISGATFFCDHYYAKINTKGNPLKWFPLFKKEDKVKKLIFNGKDFYFLSAKNTPNYVLCKTSINDLNFLKPEILVNEDSLAVITDFAVTKSGVYYVKTKNGVDARLYSIKDLNDQEIPIPKKSGYINVSSESPLNDNWWIQIKGWTNYTTRYRYDIIEKDFVKEELYPRQINPELDDVVIEEIEVSSHDGAMVPLSIVYKAGTKLNGNQRVFMDGYGAIGYSYTPYPYACLLHWISNGGIYAKAHVRGGGEKGDAWHKGGYKQTKANTWKDFIACTEYLIKKGYTSPNKMAIWGASGGGILIARAITERPELYKTAIIYAGLINMTRSEFGANGKNLIKEFGTVKDSSEFQALLEMDACHHIKVGTNYPAVLFQAGANDSRVPVWHSAKFAAGLQAANASGNPVLLSIDFAGGHGFNLTTEQWDNSIADMISFALWQTGHPDFQLKE